MRIDGNKNELSISQQDSRQKGCLEIIPLILFFNLHYVARTRTGLSFQLGLTSSSDSQLFAPMVGRIPEARCKMVRRYKSAMRTGFGRVFITKFNSVWKWGKILGRRGALEKWKSDAMKTDMHI